MKLNPKLLKQLEEREDGNERLAAALGVCPTCGQPWPKPNGAKAETRRPRRANMREAVIRYLTVTDTKFGNQSRCARELQLDTSYVNKVWREYRAETGAQTPQPEAEE